MWWWQVFGPWMQLQACVTVHALTCSTAQVVPRSIQSTAMSRSCTPACVDEGYMSVEEAAACTMYELMLLF